MGQPIRVLDSVSEVMFNRAASLGLTASHQISDSCELSLIWWEAVRPKLAARSNITSDTESHTRMGWPMSGWPEKRTVGTQVSHKLVWAYRWKAHNGGVNSRSNFMERIGLSSRLGSRTCRERNLDMVQIRGTRSLTHLKTFSPHSIKLQYSIA